MADRNPSQQRAQRPTNLQAASSAYAILRNLLSHAPNSSQFVGFLTLFISGSILLLLAGLTVTAIVFGLIFLAPLLLICSPIWVPVAAVIFISLAGFLSLCGFGVALAAGLSWTYRYFRGMNPPGSDRVDFARSRLYDTASHVKDYAREYGGYLQSKVKDAAPGA